MKMCKFHDSVPQLWAEIGDGELLIHVGGFCLLWM